MSASLASSLYDLKKYYPGVMRRGNAFQNLLVAAGTGRREGNVEATFSCRERAETHSVSSSRLVARNANSFVPPSVSGMLSLCLMFEI